jgi:hypothetical protein
MTETIIGLLVLAAVMVALVVITFWCRTIIEHIARAPGRSVREIQHHLKDIAADE